jgi:murein DD-endopeptidase MepM/ murein hydrolase activator NlpD
MSKKPFESEYLYGMHDPGGEHTIGERPGLRGWVLFTEETGHDASHHGGSAKYQEMVAKGFAVIARLNNGYKTAGTIPHSSQYQNFAIRVGKWARDYPGCHIWIIGNEMNFAVERPGFKDKQGRGATPAPGVANSGSARSLRDQFAVRNELASRGPQARGGGPAQVVNWGETITAEMYARCYTLCRDAIHSHPGHENDLVLTGAVAPWNVDTGDWIQYFKDMLTILGPEGCDGITLHTYTHGTAPELVRSPEKMKSHPDYHYQFRAYQDFMHAIPADMRHLPVYITETDQNEEWLDRGGSRWVQEAYAEIDRWNNQPGNQQIRALILYRWPHHDKWWIEDKHNVIHDFKRAQEHGYRWNAELTLASIGPPESTLSVGQQVFAAAVVNVRSTIGFRNKGPDDIRGKVPERTPVKIIGPSQQADGLTWWPVRTTLAGGGGVQGWMAETTTDGKRLLSEKALPVRLQAGAAKRFAVGGAATCVSEDVNVRRTPGHKNKPGNDVVAKAQKAMPLTIAQGPRKADGLVWWQVSGTDADGAAFEGWIAVVAPLGTRLLAPAGVSEIVPLLKPFQGNFRVTQEWAERPDVYKEITYDGIPLKGHNGIDFGLPVGTPVVATAAGRVKQSRLGTSGFGEYVLLEHEWGESIYAHMTERNVKTGQQVAKGQVLGLSGNTGNSSGPHLHFSIRVFPYRRTDGWGGFCSPVAFMKPADLLKSRGAKRAPSLLDEESLENPRP